MISLNYWAPPNNASLARIYINGIHGAAGKIFLSFSRGSIKVNADSDERDDIADLIEVEMQQLGINGSLSDAGSATDLWKQLVDACSQPRKAAPARPPSNGQMQGRPSSVGPISTLHDLDISTIKVKKPVKIQVDHREPEQLIQLLRQAQNTTVEVVSLPLGDILIDDAIIIERKRCPEDFESSVVDGLRLHDQSERIKHRTDLIGVVLLEGDLFGARQRMSIQQISGMLTFLGVIQSVNVFPTVDVVHTAYMIVKLAAHQHGLDGPISLRKDKPKALFSARKFVLEGIPGVSAGIAELLLEHFGSISRIANATVDELIAVPGIGLQRANQIRECLAGTT